MTRRPERVQTTIAIRNSRQYAYMPEKDSAVVNAPKYRVRLDFWRNSEKKQSVTLPTETADSGVVG